MSKLTKSQMIEAASDLVDVAKVSEEVVVFIPTMAEVSEKENMHNEYDLLGYFVTKHPLDNHKVKISQLEPIGELKDLDNGIAGRRTHIGGIVSKFSPKRTKAGKNMAFLELEDVTGRVEVIVFSNLYAKVEAALYQNALVEVKGKVEIDEKEINGEVVRTAKVIASFIHPLENVKQLEEIRLKILPGDNLLEIGKILKEQRGDTNVNIEYEDFLLETSHKIPQTVDLINSLKTYCLVKEIQV